jgi:hypothetical protein
VLGRLAAADEPLIGRPRRLLRAVVELAGERRPIPAFHAVGRDPAHPKVAAARADIRRFSLNAAADNGVDEEDESAACRPRRGHASARAGGVRR